MQTLSLAQSLWQFRNANKYWPTDAFIKTRQIHVLKIGKPGKFLDTGFKQMNIKKEVKAFWKAFKKILFSTVHTQHFKWSFWNTWFNSKYLTCQDAELSSISALKLIKLQFLGLISVHAGFFAGEHFEILMSKPSKIWWIIFPDPIDLIIQVQAILGNVTILYQWIAHRVNNMWSTLYLMMEKLILY